MPDYRFDQRLTPEHFQAIGELTAQWSFLEWQIEAAIWELLPANETEGRIITTQMNIRPKTQIITLLAQLRLPATEAEGTKQLMSDIMIAHGLRNKVVHGLWAKDNETGAYQLVWSSGKDENRINPQVIPMTEPRVRGMVEEAVALNDRMNAFRIYLLARAIGIVRPAILQTQSPDP